MLGAIQMDHLPAVFQRMLAETQHIVQVFVGSHSVGTVKDRIISGGQGQVDLGCGVRLAVHFHNEFAHALQLQTDILCVLGEQEGLLGVDHVGFQTLDHHAQPTGCRHIQSQKARMDLVKVKFKSILRRGRSS